ncbi:uncharacterized protein [Watersipora subatra]|uniref:uncharacterized protein isoform X2 n=1 Tax=Watersipora subatra TaxID=2589382 RepID=UPI00355AFAC3
MILPYIGRNSDAVHERKHRGRVSQPNSISPHRKPTKAKSKIAAGNHCCQQCVQEFEPANLHLPKLAPSSIMLTSQFGKEDSFTNVIDSLAEANRVSDMTTQSSETGTNQSMTSTPRFPISDHSFSQDCESELLFPRIDSCNQVTSMSEAPDSSQAIQLGLEQPLDLDECAHRGKIKCSKFNEIGNSHSRKKKGPSISSGKKWHRAESYANSSVIQIQSKKENINFMDSQLNSIYNPWEKAKIDEQLSSHTEKKARPVRYQSLPELHKADEKFDHVKNLTSKSVEKYVLNTMMRAEKAARFECRIPTIPLSLKTRSGAGYTSIK